MISLPKVTVHKKSGEAVTGDVGSGANLVVCAATRKYPYPHINFGCGIGQCGRCASRILEGAEHLPEPNWKENRRLGEHLKDGYRLLCQLSIETDIALIQDRAIPPLARMRQPDVRDPHQQTRPVQD